MDDGKWEELTRTEVEDLENNFPGGKLNDLMRRRKDGLVVPRRLLPMLPTIRNFQVYLQDINAVYKFNVLLCTVLL